jgi:trk system potassium uptake protein TrkA
MRFIVIGCGRWGAGLARTLVERGHEVAVVDVDAHAFERLGDGFRGERTVGSGLDRDVLVRAGVGRASGLAAVTFSDEINVSVSRAAREVFRVPKVIARLYDPQKAQIYRRLGIETISTVDWGVHRIADLLAYSSLDVSVSIGQGGVDLVEAEVPRLLAGRTVAELAIPGEAHVVALSRAGRTFLPTEGTVLEVGDRVHLVLVPSSVGRLRRLLGID